MTIICASSSRPLAAAADRSEGDRRTSGRRPAPQSPERPAAADIVVTDYALKGVVKRVEKELEHVTIQHEAIPGFMDAMTMRFAYKDTTVLHAPARRSRGGDVAGRDGRASSHDYELLGPGGQPRPRRRRIGSRYFEDQSVHCASSRGSSRSATRFPTSP